MRARYAAERRTRPDCPSDDAPSRLIVVTGGQSGVDRAALDAAVALAIPYAGFCPRGGVSVSKGTGLARAVAEQRGTPLFVLDLDSTDARERAAHWLDGLLAAQPPNSPLRLGVGGPRESEVGGIYTRALTALRDLLRGRGEPGCIVASRNMRAICFDRTGPRPEFLEKHYLNT